MIKVKVEGMKCVHCEAHVKNSLEALDGVESVAVDHKRGLAAINTSANINDAVIKQAIENEGYEVTEIER